MSYLMRYKQSCLSRSGPKAGDVDLVLMTGGSSLFTLADREMRRLSGARMVWLDRLDTTITVGAALLARNQWLPSLPYPLCVQLSDNTLHEFFLAGLRSWQATIMAEVQCEWMHTGLSASFD